MVDRDLRLSQVKVCLHILLHELNAPQTVVNDGLPFLELEARISAVSEEERVLGVFGDGLAVAGFSRVIVGVLEVRVALVLKLLGRVFVAWRHREVGEGEGER